MHEDCAGDSTRDWGDWASETDPTTMSVTSLRIEDDEFEDQSEEMKELHAMFPKLSLFTLDKTLEKCGGDYVRTTDELLNRVFLEEDGEETVNVRGIDSFGEDLNGFRDGKKKWKQRKRSASNSDARQAYVQRRSSLTTAGSGNSSAVPPPASHWDRINEEIQYVSEALGITRAVVSSAHHANAGLLAHTVAALLDKYNGEVVDDNDEHVAELDELMQEFGNEVKKEHLDGLLRLCKTNKVAVFKLAELLRRRLPKSGPVELPKQNYSSPPSSPLKPPYARPHHPRGSEERWTTVGMSLRTDPVSPRPQHRALDSATASHLAESYRYARNEAFQKAAASYRRSRSDKLMGGAAAFYACVGHDYNAKTKEYDDIAAEKYVRENSGADVLDLHGVTVAQAVKIARETTTQWWVESKPDEAGRGIKPFRIVTGVGRHSKGGEAKLAPAVSKMLVREKWNISVGRGEISVHGVKKG